MPDPVRGLRIAAVLPHLRVFGNVRRYVELGNALADRGHEVVLYHPEGGPPAWLPFRGATASWERLGARGHDVVLFSEPAQLERQERIPARLRIFYAAQEGEPGLDRVLGRRDLRLLANGAGLRRLLARRAGREVEDGAGAVDLERFRPRPEERRPDALRLLAYGRLSRRRKGTRLAVAAARLAARRHRQLELHLFDHVGPGNEEDPRRRIPDATNARFHLNLEQEELARLYASADLFVAAERRAGWCNTAAEALASGAALICTRSGTEDFAESGETAWVVNWRHPWAIARALDRLAADPERRARLAAAGRQRLAAFTWTALAERLEASWQRALAEPGTPSEPTVAAG